MNKSLTGTLTASRIARLREWRSWREMNDGKKEKLFERRTMRVGEIHPEEEDRQGEGTSELRKKMGYTDRKTKKSVRD